MTDEPKPSLVNLLMKMVESNNERLNAVENGLLLNDERDAERDKTLERFEVEIRQNTTTTNMLVEQLGGEDGIIQTVKAVNKSNNISAGFMAFGGLVGLGVAGWLFWMALSMQSIMFDMVELTAKQVVQIENLEKRLSDGG